MPQPVNRPFNQNPNVESKTQPTTQNNATTFSDRDILHDCLQTSKYIADTLSSFSSEAGSEVILATVEDLYLSMRDEQREFFEVMYDKGWYTLESEKPEKVTQTAQQFQTKRQELES